jgi:dipeptidyl aminopeptidase/acylaminoacyl peptidase
MSQPGQAANQLGQIKMFDLSPDGRQLLVVADGPGRRQPWLLPLDGAPARLVELDGVVLRCAWRPDGSRFIAKIDPDGRDEHQLVEVDPVSGEATPITKQPGTRNDIGWGHSARSRPYSPDGRYLAYASNRRDPSCFDVILHDLTTGAERTVLLAGDQVPEDRYFPEMFSWDSRQLLVTRLHQQTEQDVYAVDIASNQVSLLTPHDGPAKHVAVAARPEGTYLCATRDGNFTGLALLDGDGITHWIDAPDRDIEFAVLSADGGRLAWAVNEDGYSAIRHCAVRDGQPQAIEQVTCLPPDAYVFEFGMSGRILQFGDGGRTLLALDSGGTVWSVDLDKDEAVPIGPERSRERPRPETVSFTSTDGTTVSAFAYKPAGPGPFPVVIDVHGGPEIQTMPVPEPLHEKLLARGIAVLAPNIRGSSGYGLRYQRLIYRDWGGGDIEDLRAAAEFLRAQPWVDPDRLAVFGASYGGFAALCCLTMLPGYWRAGVSECGVSDQVEDIRGMPPMWRRRAKDWVGDIDDPVDLQRLIQASPITHADQVRAPVLLLHGTNDTNVDIASSDAFYARLTERGQPVDYQRIDGAGHSISHHMDVPTLVCEWLAQKLLGAEADQ